MHLTKSLLALLAAVAASLDHYRGLLLAALLALLSAPVLAAPLPLASPNLAALDLRSAGQAAQLATVTVVVGKDGSAILMGPFDAVGAKSRPYGVARLKPDGALDEAWNPALPAGPRPTGAALDEAGAVAFIATADYS